MRNYPTRKPKSGWRAGISAGLALLIAASAASGASLEAPPEEQDALDACEEQLCGMILDKPTKGGDLTCDIQKTWAKSSLEGGKSKGMSWGFGDARCTVDLTLSREDIVDALTKPRHTVQVPAHDVNCVVVREGEERPVTARLAPKLTFKRGRADKVWINLESIEGPADVRATIWTAAKLEDTLGVFHRPLIRSINRFVHRRCPRRYGDEGTEAKTDKKDKKGDRKSQSVSPPTKNEKTAANATLTASKGTAAASAP